MFVDVTDKDVSDNIVIRCIKYETDSTKCLKNDTNYTCEKRSLWSGPLFKLDGCYENCCGLDTFLMQREDSSNVYLWLCQNFSSCYGGTYDNIHIHTFPIEESIKFESLFSFSFTTRKLFHIMDPANLYSESETTTIT